MASFPLSLFGRKEEQSALPAVEAVLARMVAGGEDPLVLTAAFIDALRPPRRSPADAVARCREMLELLAAQPRYREALSSTVRHLFADREQRRFYTEAGILPNTGFFSELRRKLVHKILPELPDQRDLKDCVHLVFSHPADQRWIDEIPPRDKAVFWDFLSKGSFEEPDAANRITVQFLDSLVILAHRTAAMGLEPELLRVNPRLCTGESPFIALAAEVEQFVAGCRADLLTPEQAVHDERHILVLLEQCRSAVNRASQTAASRGTSMPLTFLIVRLSQHLERLELLVKLMAVRFDPELGEELAKQWSDFLAEVLAGERQRNSLRTYFATLLELVSLRITENASRVGEHYIARDRLEWLGILRAAAGGGFFIAVMALCKLLASSPTRPIFAQGLLNSLIYAAGFAVIHVLHLIVATKQPAMTAATIAATVSQARGHLKDSERLVALIVDTVRSQLAAIAGNVLVALPLAIAIGTAASVNSGHLLPAAKSTALLAEIDPLGNPALLYAGVAGVWLFVAGLVSGYVDNMSAYSDLGARVGRLGWLVKLLGGERAERLGSYLDRNAGGLAGNIFFGFALGMTPAIGKAFGLPLDIRHIAFSAATLGYALSALDWKVPLLTLARCVSGVAMIGLVNLAVSFALALRVALRSRGVQPHEGYALLRPLWRTLLSQPAKFLYPAGK